MLLHYANTKKQHLCLPNNEHCWPDIRQTDNQTSGLCSGMSSVRLTHNPPKRVSRPCKLLVLAAAHCIQRWNSITAADALCVLRLPRCGRAALCLMPCADPTELHVHQQVVPMLMLLRRLLANCRARRAKGDLSYKGAAAT